MASEPTLEGYLKSNSKVKAARKEMEAAGKKLNAAKKSLISARSATPGVVEDIKTAIENARTKYASIKQKTSAIEDEATADFKKNYKSISTKANKDSLSELQAALPNAKSSVEYQAIQDSINKLQGKIANPQEYVEPSFNTSPKSGGVVTQQPNNGAPLQVEDFANTLKNSRAELKKATSQQLIDLGKKLNAAGIVAPEVGEYTDALWQSYKNAIAKAQSAYGANKEFGTLNAFLDDQARQVKLLGGVQGAGGPVTTTDVYKQISSATDAAAIINQQYQSLLGRDANPQELASLTQKLNKAEEKNAQITTSTKSGTGSSSARRKTALNPSEFIAEEIKKRPEFATKTAAKETLTSQTIENTLKANGLPTDPMQLKNWAHLVETGTDIKTIQNQIREIASTGMPDNVKKLMAGGTDLSTIYSPYKQAMATTLELDPNAINLNDNTLRSAIGANGEMPIYDFQRALRKDARWQYTNNAREEVSNSVTKVLKDFGFMG
jgi:hypothetical protein